MVPPHSFGSSKKKRWKRSSWKKSFIDHKRGRKKIFFSPLPPYLPLQKVLVRMCTESKNLWFPFSFFSPLSLSASYLCTCLFVCLCFRCRCKERTNYFLFEIKGGTKKQRKKHISKKIPNLYPHTHIHLHPLNVHVHIRRKYRNAFQMEPAAFTFA